jgi:hypothetical protein
MVGTLALCPPYRLILSPRHCERSEAIHLSAHEVAMDSRKDDVKAMPATNSHDGQMTSDFQKSWSSPGIKNIPLSF